MTTQTTRAGREYSQCDYCGKKGRPRPFDDGFEWIGAPGWSAAPYPGRTLHRCPTCQTSSAPLLPEPLAWWRALVAGAPVEPDAVDVVEVEAAPAAPDAVRCTRCQHDASEHAAGHAECYVCPCARLLPNPDDVEAADVEAVAPWWRALVAGAPVEPDADGVADARVVGACAYVTRWRTPSRITRAELFGDAGAVRAWYVAPSARRAQDGQPIEDEFCEVVSAYDVRRHHERAVEVEASATHAPDAVASTRDAMLAAGRREADAIGAHRDAMRASTPDAVDVVEVGPDAELLRLTYNALVVQQVTGALDRAGLSRLEAARRAGIDPVTLARRMTGGTFTIGELGALADACGVRPSVWLRAVDDTLAGAHKLEAAGR